MLKTAKFQLVVRPNCFLEGLGDFDVLYLDTQLNYSPSLQLDVSLSVGTKLEPKKWHHDFKTIYEKKDNDKNKLCYVILKDEFLKLPSNTFNNSNFRVIRCSITTEILTLKDSEKPIKYVCELGPPYSNKLYEKKEFADFTFVIYKQELKAHRRVLAASSPVFKLMLHYDN